MLYKSLNKELKCNNKNNKNKLVTNQLAVIPYKTLTDCDDLLSSVQAESPTKCTKQITLV